MESNYWQLNNKILKVNFLILLILLIFDLT